MLPARPMYPSQSGHEIQPSSRYTLAGPDGMFDCRWPFLRHAPHSSFPFSLSFRTIALASAKGRKAPRPPSLPSQSGHEIQPSSRYVTCGQEGMFEGRWPALRHAFHASEVPSLSFRTIALAATKGSMELVTSRVAPVCRLAGVVVLGSDFFFGFETSLLSLEGRRRQRLSPL